MKIGWLTEDGLPRVRHYKNEDYCPPLRRSRGLWLLRIRRRWLLDPLTGLRWWLFGRTR